jgi:Fe-S oxidoreductase
VTYHDPCYLGRYNGVFEEPRDIIDRVPGAELTEMPRSGKRSFCCGGGGGRAFMKEDTGSRINLERVREALQTRAPVVAAACPFCMGMLEDGIGAAEASAQLRVLDIAELVAESLQAAAPAAGQRTTV